MRQRIWVPELPIVHPPTEVSLQMDVGFEGHFHVLLRNASTQEVKYSGSFKNVLTNTFMNLLGSGGGHVYSLFSALAVGAGSTTPAATDTALAAEIGTRSTNNGGLGEGVAFISGSAPSGTYWEYRVNRLFAEGQSTGTIAEFGWFNGTNLLCRSLLRDPTGSPTTITKTATDELLITYELRVIVPTTPNSSIVQFGPTFHTASVCPIRIDNGFFFYGNRGVGWMSTLNVFGSNWGGYLRVHQTATVNSGNPIGGGSFNTWPSPGTGQPTYGGAQGSPDVATLLNYTSSNYHRDIEYVIRATNAGINPGGQIQGITTSAFTALDVSFAPMWLIVFDPPIPKPDTHQVKFTLRHSWSRSGTL